MSEIDATISEKNDCAEGSAGFSKTERERNGGEATIQNCHGSIGRALNTRIQSTARWIGEG